MSSRKKSVPDGGNCLYLFCPMLTLLVAGIPSNNFFAGCYRFELSNRYFSKSHLLIYKWISLCFISLTCCNTSFLFNHLSCLLVLNLQNLPIYVFM